MISESDIITVCYEPTILILHEKKVIQKMLVKNKWKEISLENY